MASLALAFDYYSNEMKRRGSVEAEGSWRDDLAATAAIWDCRNRGFSE